MSLTASNVAKVTYWLPHKDASPDMSVPFSMADIKTRLNNELMVNRFISMFAINPKLKINRDKIAQFLDFGRRAAWVVSGVLTQELEEKSDNQLGTLSEKPTKPKRQKRLIIPDNLDIQTIIHEPPSTTCECGCQMTQIGQDVQDKLGFVPKQFYRERHVYPKYTCRNAACNRERLVQAKTDAQIIDKSIATSELLAHVLISKYADHLPLYRQSLIYQRSGVYLSDSTLADWVGRCGVQLGFLVKRLHKICLLYTSPSPRD